MEEDGVTVGQTELPHGVIDPAKEFFLALAAGPQDGSCSVEWDSNTGYSTLDGALENLKQDIDETGGEYMLYRCVPIKRVLRGKTRILDFAPKKKR